MKLNKLFAGLMMLATVSFFACDGNKPTGPTGPTGPGTGNGGDNGENPGTEVVTPTEGDTLTVAQAIAYVKSLGSDVLSPNAVYVKGVIASIKSIDVNSYGNATFDIKDADADNKFTCYQVNYLENTSFKAEDALQIGDVVVIYGKVVNYKGNTPETEGKGAAYVYSQNGNTIAPAFQEPEAQTVTIAEAKAIIDKLADGATTDDYYQITCEVAKLNTDENGVKQYHNVNYIIKDETGEMTAYKTYNVGNTKFNSYAEVPPVGSKIVVIGKLTLYNGKTYEMTPCYIKEVIELGTGTTEPTEPTEPTEAPTATPVTVEAFNAAAVDPTVYYELTVKVDEIKNETYGNINVSDATGSTYIYGLTKSYLPMNGEKATNDKSFKELGIEVGQTITIRGTRGDYNGTIEMLGAYFVK